LGDHSGGLVNLIVARLLSTAEGTSVKAMKDGKEVSSSIAAAKSKSGARDWFCGRGNRSPPDVRRLDDFAAIQPPRLGTNSCSRGADAYPGTEIGCFSFRK